MRNPEGVKCAKCRKFFLPGSMGDGGERGLCMDCVMPPRRGGNEYDPDYKRDAKRNGDFDE